MTMLPRAAALLGAGTLLGFAALAPRTSSPNPCDPRTDSLRPAPSRDLYCIELFPADPGSDLQGTAALEWVPGPFTVAVAKDGSQLFNLRFELTGLPKLPGGRRAGYVAWASPPTMTPLQRLGVVQEGRTLVGPVGFDRFVVLVSEERDTATRTRTGPIVLRGESASNRLRPPDLFQFAIGATAPPMPEGHGHHGRRDSLGWTGVPMPPGLTMLAAEMALRPQTPAWLPTAPPGTPDVRPMQVVELNDGDTLDLTAGVVLRTIGGRSYPMFGFNGQHPGPLLRVSRGGAVTVRFTNRLPLPSTVHWHGLRLDAPFDGVPHLTQEPVEPGGTFLYRLRFPDGGIYWYHPHVRDDIQQDLGLYGNILVQPASAAWPKAREAFLLLDDLLLGDDGLVPYGRDTATHAAMGRMGNLLLVNGEPHWRLSATEGERIRLFLTNAAGARTWNLSFSEMTPIALVGGDIGSYAQPVPVDHVVLAPAERQVVDVEFPRPGRYVLLNRVRALDHLNGRFFPQVDTLGVVQVSPDSGTVTRRPIRWRDTALARELAAFVARAPEAEVRTLELGVSFVGLPYVAERLMRLDSIYFMPVEWAGTMPGMNWATTAAQARWRLRDLATGRDNHDIHWRFRRGGLLRLTLVGARDVLHAMQHPIHLHGQRFLVLAVGGIPNHHLVWKDTVLVPAGGTVELLVDLSNPGPWMLHCHIAEHLGAGMMTTILVEEE
jgi:FtsP/CotA-like multicopper oxidase with cupredoxin domain